MPASLMRRTLACLLVAVICGFALASQRGVSAQAPNAVVAIVVATVIDGNGGTVKLPRGSSDAALMPYHIERSKLYVMDRIGHSKILDATRIARAIEYTRIRNTYGPGEDDEDGMLLRAADLIGQLGDPHYLRKANALYHEFNEVGMNRQLGYTSPADLTRRYPQHYWNTISPHIQTAIRYLNFTSSGRQWIANLYANIFCAERDLSLSGPER